MEKRLFTIAANDRVAADTYRLRLEAVALGYRFSGEFVDIALPGYYLRRPLSVCDAGDGWLQLLYKVVGDGTRLLSTLPAGTVLDVLTGLGHGFSADACRADALLVGGGLGAAPLHLLAKELKAQGRHVTAIMGFNTADEVVLDDEFRALADRYVLVTTDGSRGMKGFSTDAIRTLQPSFDFFYTCGPMVMMRAVCQQLADSDGEASLEERMGCGAGFCYGCSCHTTVGPRRVCMDGPVFRKEEIQW